LSIIHTAVFSPYSVETFAGSIEELRTLVVDGSSIIGTSSFSYLWAAGTPNETVISGNLTPTLYSVTVAPAVPEPATWALLLMGLAGAAVVFQGRREHLRKS